MKGSRVLGIFFAVTIAPYLLISFMKYRGRKEVAATTFDVYKDEVPGLGFSIGSCSHPIVFKNVIKYFDNEACKLDNTDEKGACGDFIKSRMLEYWSDSIIEALPSDHVSSHQDYAFYDTSAMTLDDYFNDPKYGGYMIHSLHQVGTNDEYERFYQFEDDGKIHNETNIFDILRSNRDWVALGQQFFISQTKHSGSLMHFAMGINGFVMLAGRKRWLLVHPAYLDDAGCTTGQDGIFGDCRPNGHRPGHGNISATEYKRILIDELNVPKNAIFDITLEPGDLFINCPLFAHTIENLDDISVAMSFREVRKEPEWTGIFFIEKIIKGLLQSLRTKYILGNFEKITLFDMFIQGQGTGQPDLFEKDERFDGNTFLNSQTDNKAKKEAVKQ